MANKTMSDDLLLKNPFEKLLDTNFLQEIFDGRFLTVPPEVRLSPLTEALRNVFKELTASPKLQETTTPEKLMPSVEYPNSTELFAEILENIFYAKYPTRHTFTELSSMVLVYISHSKWNPMAFEFFIESDPQNGEECDPDLYEDLQDFFNDLEAVKHRDVKLIYPQAPEVSSFIIEATRPMALFTMIRAFVETYDVATPDTITMDRSFIEDKKRQPSASEFFHLAVQKGRQALQDAQAAGDSNHLFVDLHTRPYSSRKELMAGYAYTEMHDTFVGLDRLEATILKETGQPLPQRLCHARHH